MALLTMGSTYCGSAYCGLTFYDAPGALDRTRSAKRPPPRTSCGCYCSAPPPSAGRVAAPPLPPSRPAVSRQRSATPRAAYLVRVRIRVRVRVRVRDTVRVTVKVRVRVRVRVRVSASGVPRSSCCTRGSTYYGLYLLWALLTMGSTYYGLYLAPRAVRGARGCAAPRVAPGGPSRRPRWRALA